MAGLARSELADFPALTKKGELKNEECRM